MNIERRFACMLSLMLLSLGGCTVVNDSGISSPQKAGTLVRVIDAAYNSQAIDAYAGTKLIASNVGAPSVSSYASLGSGAVTMKVTPTGKTTTLAQVTGTLTGSEQHSLYITGRGTGLQLQLLSDQNTPAPAGSFSMRFLQQAVATGAVDIYLVPDGTKLTAAKPVVANLAPGKISAYTNVRAGTYDLVIVPAGTTATANAYVSDPTVFSSSQVKTALITDSQLLSSPPVDVLMTSDLN